MLRVIHKNMFHFFKNVIFEVSIKVAYIDLVILKPSIFYADGHGASFKTTFSPPSLADVPNFTFSEKNSKRPWPWNITLRPKWGKGLQRSYMPNIPCQIIYFYDKEKASKNCKTDIHSITLNFKSMTLTPKQKVAVQDIYNPI